MTEKISIVNQALLLIGEQEVSSLEDDLERARQARVHYIPTRDAVLEAHEWSFAIKRWIPGKLEDTPIYGVNYAFSVPPDILRVIAVERNDAVADGTVGNRINSREQLDWVLENGLILCNEEVIYARGIRRVEEEGMFSPLFVEAFAFKLAYKLAISLAASQEIQGNMYNLYEVAINEAKSRDGMQGRSRRFRNRTLHRVR